MDVLITASFVAIATAAVAIVIRKFQRFQEVSQFSRLNGCQTLPHESDFWYDYLGIFKVVELALNFRQRKFLDYTNALFARYGDTYASNIFGQKIIFTYNEQNIRHVLTTGFSDYDSPQLGAHLFRSVTPKSIFTADGPEWKRMRNLLRSQFSNNRSICDLDMFEKHVQNFIQSVPPNGEALDLQARLADLCLDITTCFTLGESVDALSPTQFKEKKRFAKDMIYIKETIARHGFLGPLGRLTRKTRFYNACAGVQEFVQFYADRALARNNEKSDGAQVSGRDPRDYAFIRGLTEHTKDVSELTDQSLCLLLAAVDSVTTVLSATFFLLARNEPVAKKLRASILDSIGNNPPTYDQLKTFRYMRCVFNEAMRLFPPVPLNARMANKDTILPCGGGVSGTLNVLVQKGQIVVFSTWASHSMSEDFVDQPEAFIPERWEKLSCEPSSFVPFNRGPRMCPGQQYAMIEASYVITRLLQNFSTITNHDSRGWTERVLLTLENENGVIAGLS